jgi:hypothetical protein
MGNNGKEKKYKEDLEKALLALVEVKESAIKAFQAKDLEIKQAYIKRIYNIAEGRTL